MASLAVASLPFSRLSLHPSPPLPPPQPSLRFSSSHYFAFTPLSNARRGFFVSDVARRPLICFAAAATTKKKADSADKRARQAAKRRLYNKSRKSEIRTRMKKVLVALEGLRKQTDPTQDMISPIETLISEAFSKIDKAVKVGTLHRNTGARRKSRLSRAKKTLEAQLGWYTPNSTSTA